ncbi:MAG: sulfatase [Verrucomicrobiota bacterium]
MKTTPEPQVGALTNFSRILVFLTFLAWSAWPSSVAADPVNVIIFIADDISSDDLGCYGNKAARTPNIDALATNGLKFTNAILTTSSCSPSRSSIITGRYPHNLGPASELHMPIAAHLVPFPELLREAGYYSALIGKDHMKWEPGAKRKPWDLNEPSMVTGNNGGHAGWLAGVRDRPKNQPFFFWLASHDAHRQWDGDRDWVEELYGQKHDPANVVVPPSLIDDAETRKDFASYYNEVTRFDYFIGVVVKQLREEGVLDNTLVFIMADNGRPFAGAKTRFTDSGMKTPLIAHWPKGIVARGVSTPSLVSSIDLAPTILEIAGVKKPESFQGVSLLPLFKKPEAVVRTASFSEHNWHDYEAHGRSVRADGFLYIENHRPSLAWQGAADSVKSPSHKSLLAARDAGTLNAAQADHFLAPRPLIELYDLQADPHQMANLSGKPEHAERQSKLQELLKEWKQVTGDTVPQKLTPDGFDRETGQPLAGELTRGEVVGAALNADHINAPGPR